MTIATRWRASKGRSIRDLFRRDRRGAAAAEFALIVPVALALFTGTITYSNAIYIDRKVTLTTRTVTDLVTQYTTIPKAGLQNLLGASAQIIAPYPAAFLGVTVSEVTTDAAGKATIDWSQPLNVVSTVRHQGDVVTLPSAIDTPNATYIFGEVRYTYTPSIGYQVTGPITLSDQTFMSPRLSSKVTCPDC